jgi:exonuclease SbcC
MITRIEITNFMSHQHTVIEPAPGLTVLVGPNNCGKSAIVSALQILCSNDNSTHVLRHGEKECSVTVETDDGHTITWRRKKSCSYLIDGAEFSRLQQSGLPDELHQALRLPRVDAGSDVDFDVHFGTQKDPIFLLRSPAAHAAKFFASSSDAIHLVEMQKRHKEKLENARREKNRLEAESKQLTAELETLGASLDLDRRCEQVEELYTQIVSRTACMDSAQSLAEQWERKSFSAWLHRHELELLAPLSSPPVLEDTDALAGLIERLKRAEQRFSARKIEVAALDCLPEPPLQHDVHAFQRLIAQLADTQRTERRNSAQLRCLDPLQPCPAMADHESLSTAVTQLDAALGACLLVDRRQRILDALDLPPQLDDAAALESMMTRLSQANAQANVERRVSDVLSAMAVPPVQEKVTPLEELLGRMDQVQRSVSSAARSLQSVHSDLEGAEAALRRYTTHNACPTCGGALDAERVLASAMANGDRCHG